MKTILALALACGSLLLAGDPNVNADVSVKAGSISRQGPVHHLRGNAMLETSAVSVRADEIDFNQETNEIDAKGSVHVKLKGNPSYLFVDGTRDRESVSPSQGLPRRRPTVVEIIK
jgi:lipopolysaccharide assembly outer membrane protein LptD (OstA)